MRHTGLGGLYGRSGAGITSRPADVSPMRTGTEEGDFLRRQPIKCDRPIPVVLEPIVHPVRHYAGGGFRGAYITSLRCIRGDIESGCESAEISPKCRKAFRIAGCRSKGIWINGRLLVGTHVVSSCSRIGACNIQASGPVAITAVAFNSYYLQTGVDGVRRSRCGPERISQRKAVCQLAGVVSQP